MKLYRTLVLCTLVVLCGTFAWAQGTAEMSGIVKDESGAVLPGVTVTVTQTATGQMRTVVTSDNGTYVITSLPTGPYTLEAALQGFRTFMRTGIVLQVGAAPTIDVRLTLGALEESITVAGEAPLVDVKRSGISEVVEQSRIVELPLQGRQVTALLVLSGAAVSSGGGGGKNRSDSMAISVAGGLRTGVTYTLDGAMHNDGYDNLNLSFPFPDALQEFQVATGGLSAETGMHSSASVNAVTKSGTNRFSGAGFEFLRDHRFNSTDPFAAIGPDGKRRDDGLNRNQFGGVFGGPIFRDRLFFFGGYQGTRSHQTPTSNIAWVPTAAMLAGDFTERASPACNAGRQLTLRAPFVNNRVDPSLVNPIAVSISKYLQTSTDPCGQITYGAPTESGQGQGVVRFDYHPASNQTLFLRYLDTSEHIDAAYDKTNSPIGTVAPKTVREHVTAVGLTTVLGSNSVNSIRATWMGGGTHINDPAPSCFDFPSLGVKVHTYVPNVAGLTITDGFSVNAGVFTLDKSAYAADDVFTTVQGAHQLSAGVNLSRWAVLSSDKTGNGSMSFLGRQTGLGMADFITGKLNQFRQSAPGVVDENQWYVGLFAQDAWRMTERVTLNGGLRWEPYFGQNLKNGAVVNFSLEDFRQGIKTTQFKNAPPGILFPGDNGFTGKKGLDKQWWNLSPRLGIAWDVNGNGRTAVRSSYAMNYDLPTGQFMFKASSSAPFGNRLVLNGTFPIDNPYRDFPGGDPHPIPYPPDANAQFPAYSPFLVLDANLNSPRVQTWNVTVERQVGTAWLTSASYLGSYIDRIWGNVQLNPGVFKGTGACVLNGVSYPVCTVAGNVDQRRVLSLENPVAAQGLGFISRVDDVGTQNYRAIKLTAARRSAGGVSLSTNYTLSHCDSDTYTSGSWFNYEESYLSSDPSFDRGNCLQTVRQIANASVSAETPQFSSRAMRAALSGWRVSGILSARSGSWLTATTNVDIAGTGTVNQRLNQVSDNVYGEKTLTRFLDRAAFAPPAAGTLGNERNNSIQGPGYWTVDTALSRTLRVGATRTFEFRLETFNLLNNFNWGNPVTVWDNTTFGLITSMNGSPRVVQFGVKYGF